MLCSGDQLYKFDRYPSFIFFPLLNFSTYWNSILQLLLFLPRAHGLMRFFLFYILKKIKFQKYMSAFKYFKNIPRSPSHRATGPMCNFFLKFATKSLEKKKGHVAPPNGRQGPVAHPSGDRPPPFFLSDFYFCRDLFWAIRACIRHHRRQDLGR